MPVHIRGSLKQWTYVRCRYGGTAGFKVLSALLRVDVLVLDRPILQGENGPRDPAVRGTSPLALIEYNRASRESQISISEATESAKGDEPPVFVEHDGSIHFAGFFSSNRPAYPTPRILRQMVEQCREEPGKSRARN